MTEEDKVLRASLQPRGHTWVTNGVSSADDYDGEESVPVPIYAAFSEYPPGVTSHTEIAWSEVEDHMVINTAVFNGKIL